MAKSEIEIIREDIGEALETSNDLGGPFGYRFSDGKYFVESYTDEGNVDKVYEILVEVREV